MIASAAAQSSHRRDGTSDHRGASTFSMTPLQRRVGGDALELELRAQRRSGAAAPPGASDFTSSGTTYAAPLEERGGLGHLEQRDASAR